MSTIDHYVTTFTAVAPSTAIGRGCCVAALLVLSACGTSEEAGDNSIFDSCTLNSECAVGELCVGGVCAAPPTRRPVL